ncbi:MAG: YncE family protein, partial [Terriglobales bacterium]
ELAAINPRTLKIVARYPLPGIEDPHGIALDPAHTREPDWGPRGPRPGRASSGSPGAARRGPAPVIRLAFIAGEGNHTLAVFNLKTRTLLSRHQVGADPDVLAFDPGLKRLYVSAESGTVTVFQESGHDLILLGRIQMPHAHTVAVDPGTHLVYFPLQDIDGRPLLRIMKPAGPQ